MEKRRFVGLRWPGSTRMVVFGRAVLSDGFDMLKVPARCSRWLLAKNLDITQNDRNRDSECNRLWVLKNCVIEVISLPLSDLLEVLLSSR